MSKNTHKWEYRVERVNNLSLRQLNEIGSLGWELCGTVATPEPPSDMTSNWPALVQYYFKRQIK